MGFEDDLLTLSNADHVTVRHVNQFRENHKTTCTNCLSLNPNITHQYCVDKCKFYKEQVETRSDIASSTKKLVSYFYDKHPYRDLVSNPTRDNNAIKALLEYLQPKQIARVIDYMHYNRKPDLVNIAYFVNEALVHERLREERSVPGTAAWLVTNFYETLGDKFKSPNFVRDCVVIEQNLEQLSSEEVIGVFELMIKQNHSDLRMFNYVRNEYLSKNNNQINTNLMREDDLFGDEIE